MTDQTAEHGAGTIETKKDLPPGPEGVYKLWVAEITLAEKLQLDWIKDARVVKRIYRNADKAQSHGDRDSIGENRMNKFNILWSNTETLRPALFNSTPKPDVRRRFRDEDELGAKISEVAERALEVAIDEGDVEGVIDKAVLDHLLPGRGLARVRYVPTFKKQREEVDLTEEFNEFEPEFRRSDTNALIEDESEIQQGDNDRQFIFGDEFDELVFEEVKVDLVRWDRFTHGPGSVWGDVTWIKFDHFMKKANVTKAFGSKIAKELQYNDKITHSDEKAKGNDHGEDSEATPFKRALIWEIWDKEERKVIWISPSFKEGPLKTEDDPLGLNQFFPIPEPLYSIDDTDTLLPIPEFVQYADQARELDKITARINKLISGLKAKGIYDSSIKAIETLETATDNQLVPVEEVSALLDKGGLRNAIWMYPIETLVQVLASLYIQRDQIRATIFEITGISDIQRGVSDPNETARAQSIKSRFGTQRLARRQRAVAKFVRNIIRLMAEIMMEKFSPETIQIMTGKELTPEMLEVMRQDGAREFRIDIETDSTIANQQEVDEANITKLLSAIAQYIAGVGPAVESGAIPAEAAFSILLGAIRKFKFGREVEDALLKAQAALKQQGDQGQGGGPNAEQAQAQADQQQAQAEIEIQQAKSDNDAKIAQQKMENENRLADEKAEAEILLKREIALEELDIKREAMRAKAETDELAVRLKAQHEKENTDHGSDHNTGHMEG